MGKSLSAVIRAFISFNFLQQPPASGGEMGTIPEVYLCDLCELCGKKNLSSSVLICGSI